MRMRALRWAIALTFAVGAATAGVGVHHTALRAVLRDIARSSGAQVQATTAAGLPGSDVSTRTHARVPGADASIVAAAVLAAGVVVVVAVARRRQRVAVAVHDAHGPRAPPVWS